MRKSWVAIVILLLAVAIFGPIVLLSGVIVGGGAIIAAAGCQAPLLQVAVAQTAESTTTLPKATTEYLEKRNVKSLAEQNMERYLAAQTAEGVPWQVIAALHYREAGMDPTKSISNGATLGSGVNVDGVNVVEDANQDAINMAKHFKRMAKSVYGIDVEKDAMTAELWGQAFLAYNRGSLYKRQGSTYDQSPYVMNGLDESHMNMRWVAADTVNGVDGNKAGALTVLQYLGAGSSNASSGLSCEATSVTADLANPLDGKMVVSSIFGERFHPIYHRWILHDGLDIVGSSGIQAISAGKVVWSGPNGTLGNYVKIDHGNGLMSGYGHMSSIDSAVKVGATVQAGQHLGVMGKTGAVTGVHVHLKIWVPDSTGKSVSTDPEEFLATHGIIIPRQSGLPKSPYVK
ncbi:MAG: peptidoglycan lytic protein [Candidatus Saccharibacteria bacterium]|nr:peptidoglycan lytic protein [Candidatus Saccharibacteria bacterium]